MNQDSPSLPYYNSDSRHIGEIFLAYDCLTTLQASDSPVQEMVMVQDSYGKTVVNESVWLKDSGNKEQWEARKQWR